MQARSLHIDTLQVEETKKKENADIPGVSMAILESEGKPITKEWGVIERSSNKMVDSETQFGVASLSKPVFAYLVLKLIEDNKPGHAPQFFKFKKQFDLETPLHTILPNPRFSECGNIDQLNTKNILSHQTGLPLNDEDFKKVKKRPYRFSFAPGSGKYQYSNVGITCLQEVIEELTGEPLPVLAKKVVFERLDMPNSEFVPHDLTSSGAKSYAACDLRTTPTDYANFMLKWWKDESVNFAFQPLIFMTHDDWAQRVDVALDDLKHVAWGLGIALQTNDQGKPVSAFHTGDMNSWRAVTALNLANDRVAVLCSNGSNGHMLIEQMLSPDDFALTHSLNFFFTKFGFARNIKNDYELGLVSEAEREPGKIYLENTREGLQYEFMLLDGKLEQYLLPWHKLPSDFPVTAFDLVQLPGKFLSNLLLEEARFIEIGKRLQLSTQPDKKMRRRSTGNIAEGLGVSPEKFLTETAATLIPEPKKVSTSDLFDQVEQAAPLISTPLPDNLILPRKRGK